MELLAVLPIFIALLAALPISAASNSFYVASFSSRSCSSKSTLVETITATSAKSEHCFAFTQSMQSFNVLMDGTCRKTTFYFDNKCANAFGADEGSPWAAGCQTFDEGPMGSFKVTC